MKEDNNKLNIKKINDTVNLTNKILKIFYALTIISLIFISILVLRQTKFFNILFTILSVCMPVFIGFFLAWLFNPLVTLLEKKGLNRCLSSILMFLLLILILGLVIITVVPSIINQFKDFLNTVPSLFNDIKRFILNSFNGFNNIDGFNMSTIKLHIIKSLQKYVTGITTNLPTTIINIFSSTISFIGIFLVGIIIGFYMLCHFSSIKKHIFDFVPEKNKSDIRMLLHKISDALYSFLKGVLIDASLIFIICSIAFSIIGLKSPLLFALFCAITNIIPYIGPYIGAVPAVIVGLTQSTGIGISVGIAIFIIQFIEGNIIDPLIMSRQIKLHPVYIIIGLLIFGHFFGIVGMIISTPLLALLKILYEFVAPKIGLIVENSDVVKNKKSIIIGRRKK